MEAECEEELEEVKSNPQTATRLEELLSLDQLEELKCVFFDALHAKNISGKKLSKDEFGKEIKCLLKSSALELHISRMFSKMGVPEGGSVDWEGFCSYMLAQYLEKDTLKQITPPFQDLPRVRSTYSKETISRIICVHGPTRILTVCKDASVGVWTPSFQFQHTFEASDEEVGPTSLMTGPIKRSKVMVTDCLIMENCAKLVLSVTKRELQFHDIPSSVSSTGRTMRIKLFDLPHVPICLCYHGSSQGSPSILLYGDENGDIHLFTFANPNQYLFVAEPRKAGGVVPRVSYNMLADQAPHVLHQLIPGVHVDWIRRLQYLPENHSIISCSSSQPSLVIKDLLARQRPYLFRIRKGVECFMYDGDFPLLVTGGMDHAVRLWNPYVTSKPIAYLHKHSSTVLDVLICRNLGLLFSFSQDGLLCAWELYEHYLVQVISVKFPFIQRLRDHGARSLFTGFKARGPSILATSNEFFTEYELGIPGSVGRSGAVGTDSAPITSALYSPLLSQVVVGSEASTVTVWDIDTGRKVLHFPRCHGNHEITCMVVDMGGRRFLTGTRYGEVKIWNSTTGECLKVLQHDHKTEVTGIVPINDKKLLMTVGWNKQVVAFPDDEDSFKAVPLEGWEATGQHEDDILCCSYLHPRFLATGSFDGVIRVWNIENVQLVKEFHSQSTSVAAFDPSRNLRRASCVSSRMGAESTNSGHFPSRPASRRVSMYKMKLASTQLKRAPVDALLFLQTRGRAKLSGCGLLVSSDQGEGRFWDMFGAEEPIGTFPLNRNADEHCMTLDTDPQNQYLVAGDTGGGVVVFDIKDYCMVTGISYRAPTVVGSWRAHNAEVTSVQYVDHSSQPLVLSASGDTAVRLWTLKGHFVGTFGQEKLWNLDSPSSFQHPKTSWGDVQQSMSTLQSNSGTVSLASRSIRRSSQQSQSDPAADTVAASQPTFRGPAGDRSHDRSHDTDSELSSSSSSFKLPRSLRALNKEKAALGQPYKDQLVRRMRGRKERRDIYAGIDLKSTQRFGSVCSPFQALALTSVNDLPDAQKDSIGCHGDKKHSQVQFNNL